MLVLTRRKDECIVVDDKIVIKVLKINQTIVRLGIEAPSETSVLLGSPSDPQKEVRSSGLYGELALPCLGSQVSFEVSLRRDETVSINKNIVVTVADIRCADIDKVRLGIDVPKDVSVHRQEMYELIHRTSPPTTKAHESAPVVNVNSAKARVTKPKAQPNELPEHLATRSKGKRDDGLAIDPSLVAEILVRFIRNEITRTGFRRAVLGLSGGVDSSTVAYLAATALGPENVLAVTMPYKTSSGETRDHSRLVVDRLGVPTLDVPITPQVDAYFATVGTGSRMRLANKCARERMTILYDQSAAFEGLVLGTSNKTELLLGYGTHFGDLASAINPIGDLYKTQLRHLAAHLGVPDEILKKAPSGDLWEGQTDEGELGFTYEEVDRLLVLLVDRRWQPPQLVAAGFAPEFVEQVMRLIRRNQYKRRMPVIAKLTHRTVDRDFRYPRDWGT